VRPAAAGRRALSPGPPPADPVDRYPGGAARLVAVPGLGLSVAVTRRALERVPAPWSVVLLPAYGRRVPGGTTPSPERLAELLLADPAVGDGAAVVLVGHSASCQVVAEAAVRAPDRVRALVLVGPTTDPRAATWPRLAGRWLRTAAHENPSQLPLLVHAYARTGLVSMRRGMEAARRHRLDRVLAAVRCPVLVVRGRHDAICPADWAQELAATARLGRSETLPAGAHMVPITQPAALAACIAGFLAVGAPG
jgi:pimeloyl-ACP methyl ester carboxylesterase